MVRHELNDIVGDARREALQDGCVVTIGNFDGVHLGHQAILDDVLAGSRRREMPSVAVTFEPHPVTLFRGVPAAELRLTTAAERERLLTSYGIEHVVTVPFSRAFAGLTAEEFARDFLAEALRASWVHVGYDFNFGRGRQGDVDMLRGFGEAFGFDVQVHDAVEHRGEPVSSTRVRSALRAGRVRDVAELLDRPHELCGVPRAGAGRGREMGIPTVNIYPADVLLPARGVYATRFRSQERWWDAATNVGVNPTFEPENDEVSVETYVLDEAYSGVRDGEQVRVALIERLREERAYPSAEEMLAQIDDDVAATRTILADRDTVP